MERGIIAAPGIIQVHGNGFTLERGLSPQELRYYIFYWDKVVIPASNLVYIGIPEEEVLIETGVISRPKVGFTGSFNGAAVANSFAIVQAMVAQKLIAEERTTEWVVHQIGNNLILPSQFMREFQLIRVDLINALPVPDANVPIPDIIEFKERRRDELLNLHQCLDETYQEILSSPDPSLANKSAVERLKRSIAEVESVCSEKWKKITKFDFSAELNLQGRDILKGAAVGSVFDFLNQGFTIPLGMVIGALATLIKLKAKVSSSFEPAKNGMKLSYLSKAHAEKIIR